MPSEYSEWYRRTNRVDLDPREKAEIERTVGHLTTIIGDIFGKLEEFDQFGRQVSVYRLDSGKPINLEIAFALYGEQEIQNNPDSNQFEQYNKITFGEHYVALLLNRDNTIREIQTNISTDTTYTVFRWLDNAYKQIDMILNSADTFYLEGDGFTYHGPEETE